MHLSTRPRPSLKAVIQYAINFSMSVETFRQSINFKPTNHKRLKPPFLYRIFPNTLNLVIQMKNSTSGKYANNHYNLLQQWKVTYVTFTKEKLFCKEYYNIRSTRSNTSCYNLRVFTFRTRKQTFWKIANSLHPLNLSPTTTVTLWRNEQTNKNPNLSQPI